MTEQATLHPAFTPHLLNAQGLDKSQRLRAAFSALLCEVEALLPLGRELAIVRTKLEEACMFAVRGVVVAAENQATQQPGQVKSLNAIIDRYDAEATAARNALTEAGIPDVADGRSLSLADRVRLLSRH